MEIKLKLNDKRQGSFYIEEENELVAEMVIRVEGPHLTVYHTEVAEKAEGKGYAKLLLNEMVDYARKHQLKVMPLCLLCMHSSNGSLQTMPICGSRDQ